MPKPKAPRWLTQAFADGVDDRWAPVTAGDVPLPRPAYRGASPFCWLAAHDPAKQPCNDKLERFHFIPRQRVEAILWDLLPWQALGRDLVWALIHVAAWDARNGEYGCEHHHRRFDGHATSPRAPKIEVDLYALPQRVWDYVYCYGFETEANRRFVQ